MVRCAYLLFTKGKGSVPRISITLLFLEKLLKLSYFVIKRGLYYLYYSFVMYIRVTNSSVNAGRINRLITYTIIASPRNAKET